MKHSLAGMLPARYVMNLQMKLEYRIDIAILTWHSGTPLAFAL